MARNFPPLSRQPPLQNSRTSRSYFHAYAHTQSDLHTHTHIQQLLKAAAMVVALGPGKFYGSSLPRPRFYTDVKFNDERVDPPPSVMDPLKAWAEEAHWSMGGLNFKRHRLQGRIEGKIERLRAQRESVFKKSQKQQKSATVSEALGPDKDSNSSRVTKTPSPPLIPVALKRRRVVDLVDEEEEAGMMKRAPVRKLVDDFERVARESGISNGGESDGTVAARTRSKKSPIKVGVDLVNINKRNKLVKGGRKIGAAVVAAAVGIRSSPRLDQYKSV
ncbi:hypothetical protein OROGR_015239 [Orobanche gracilis]